MRGIRERPVDDARAHTIPAQQFPDRPRPHGIGRALDFLDQAEAQQRLREAEVRQQVQRLGRSRHHVARRRIHARLVRQFACGHRGPHRRGLCGPQRRQVHHRSAVEQAAEIRKPPPRGIRGNEVERGAVEQNHLDARARLRRCQLRRHGSSRRRSGLARPAEIQRPRDRHPQRQPEHRRQDATAALESPLQQRQTRAHRGTHCEDDRAVRQA